MLSHTTFDLTAEQNWLQSLTGSYPSRTVSYEYNEAGQLVEVDGARTDVADITTYEYDASGNQITVTNALGHSSKVTKFDAAGRPLHLIAANGLVTELTYNERGWLSTKTIVTGENEDQSRATTEYHYAHSGDYLGKGQIERVVAPNGSVTKYTYDKAYRVKSIENNLGEKVVFTRDLEGNPTQTDTFNTQGELVKQQQQQFNELSQLIAQVGVHYRVDYHYNGQGLLTQTTNGLGNATSQAFDALNRLIETTDALGGVIYRDYNSQNKLTHLTDQRGLTTEYQYNGFGEKVKQISPDSGITTYEYNNSGLLTKKIENGGQATEFDYDAIGRVTHIHYISAANEDVFYKYDEQEELEGIPLAVGEESYAIGHISHVNDSSGSSKYRYNAKGQLTANVYQLQGQKYTQLNQFNRQGQLSVQKYPSGVLVSYGYDAIGRINKITRKAESGETTDIIDNVSYLPFEGIERIAYANGVYQHNVHDIDGRLESIRISKGLNALYSRARA